jgi:hypothetical protein
MRKSIILFFLILFRAVMTDAQNLNAYSDVRNYFYIFDDGKLVEAEYLPVAAPSVGGNAVAYIDNSSNFKIYYNGSSHIEDDNKPDKFTVTDNLVVYDFNKRLSVFDRGQSSVLCYQHGVYAVGDSVVAFYDTISSVLKMYKDGVIKEVESLYDKAPPISMKAGDNVVGWVNYNGFLKGFYNGQTFDLESVPPARYKVGNNTIAYVDGATQNFKVFYKGQILFLETFPPASFKVGDDLIAYTDNQGNFKVFYMGEVTTVLTYAPLYFDAVDHMVVYGDNVNFNAFFNGKSIKLESYKPDSYQIDYNGVAYKDKANHLRFFSDGTIKDVTSRIVNTYQLTRNVLMYSTDMDDMHFFSNGKNY